VSVERQMAALNNRLALAGLEIQVRRLGLAAERVTASGAPDDEVAGTFDLEGKAMTTTGGLTIEGQAGGISVDRAGEAFLPGVLEAGLRRYLKNPVLVYHHKTDQALGVVEQAKVGPGGELIVRARLDDPEPGTPLADVWRKVKSGTIKGLSVGGIFKRKMTPQGMRIYSAEIVEISVTPVPMEPGSLFTLSGRP
jgi:HK97 family phage prohead protease